MANRKIEKFLEKMSNSKIIYRDKRHNKKTILSDTKFGKIRLTKSYYVLLENGKIYMLYNHNPLQRMIVRECIGNFNNLLKNKTNLDKPVLLFLADAKRYIKKKNIKLQG